MFVCFKIPRILIRLHESRQSFATGELFTLREVHKEQEGMEDWKEIIRIVYQLVRKITNKILEVNGCQCLAAFEMCEVLQKYLLASLSM